MNGMEGVQYKRVPLLEIVLIFVGKFLQTQEYFPFICNCFSLVQGFLLCSIGCSNSIGSIQPNQRMEWSKSESA